MAKKKKGLIIALTVFVLFSALYFVLKSLNLSKEEMEEELLLLQQMLGG